MSGLDDLLSRLDAVRRTGDGRWRARCPGCGGKSSKLAIKDAGGRTLLHCFAGCDVQTIVGAVGLDLAALFPPRVDDDKRKPAERKPWRAGEVINALRGELLVAWIILTDVALGQPHSNADRMRAGVARERITHFMQELENAR